ncbi:hypothetical protein [Ornithinibacillus halotolerans]|uniref:hypothetical protein n=1 Tax=Ornithinibacillus halotolerans TaxID=1274357 RepID=UPI00166C0A92|nr:hypothetical protein [Ornithinibacillus halotolerans]
MMNKKDKVLRSLWLLSGVLFLLTLVMFSFTYGKLPNILSIYYRIDQLFFQQSSTTWDKSDFGVFFVTIFIFINFLVHIILPFIGKKKPELLYIRNRKYWFSKESLREEIKKRLKYIFAYSGVYVNLIFLVSYCMMINQNGIKSYLPHFLALSITIISTLWYMVWIFKQLRPGR